MKLVKSLNINKEVSTNLLVSESLDLEAIAWESNFYQRKPKKITASSLFVSLWNMQQLGKNTLRNWCVQIGEHIGDTVNKESLNERLNDKAVDLAKLSLEKALNKKVDKAVIKTQKSKHKYLLELFNDIILRDSTTQQVSDCLNSDLPGSHSNGNPTAIMRIQAAFNYTQEKWVYFEVNPYTDNDQKAAAGIADYLQANDLLLQDLGYFTLSWLEQLIEKQYVITKWDNRTMLLDIEGNELVLLDLVKGKKKSTCLCS